MQEREREREQEQEEEEEAYDSEDDEYDPAAMVSLGGRGRTLWPWALEMTAR